MKELDTLRRECEGQSIISVCIEEIRQVLGKYDYPRSVSQPIDKFIAHIEKELDKSLMNTVFRTIGFLAYTLKSYHFLK